MTPRRPSQRDLAAARRAERQQGMDKAIAAGRPVVRQMTPEERERSDARRAAASPHADQRRGRRDAARPSRAPNGRT
jgi:hypothetical protein